MTYWLAALLLGVGFALGYFTGVGLTDRQRPSDAADRVGD